MRPTYHLDVSSAERMITSRTRAIIPVHLYGRAMDLRKVAEFAAAYRLQIIEDAAQAHGSAYNGAKIGPQDGLLLQFLSGQEPRSDGDAGAVTTETISTKRGKLRLLRDHGSPARVSAFGYWDECPARQHPGRDTFDQAVPA